MEGSSIHSAMCALLLPLCHTLMDQSFHRDGNEQVANYDFRASCILLLR